MKLFESVTIAQIARRLEKLNLIRLRLISGLDKFPMLGLSFIDYRYDNNDEYASFLIEECCRSEKAREGIIQLIYIFESMNDTQLHEHILENRYPNLQFKEKGFSQELPNNQFIKCVSCIDKNDVMFLEQRTLTDNFYQGYIGFKCVASKKDSKPNDDHHSLLAVEGYMIYEFNGKEALHVG